MAKSLEKQKVLELRKAGKSYSQIRKIIKVSKSTLSLWLRDYPLSSEKIKELRDWNEERIEHYRETRKRQREVLLNKIYREERGKILPLSSRDIFIGGLFLYWGEGSKTKFSELILSNTNPAIIKTFMYWLENSFGINRKQFKARLQLYSDMHIQKEINFWSKALGITRLQFRKSYIKKNKQASITYKNGLGHGTCNLIIGNAILAKRVLMSLRAVTEYFNGLVA